MGNKALKLITLNVWGGHVKKPLFNFIESHQDIDIFCLQEVYSKAPAKITDEERYINLDLFSEVQALLPKHQGYFRPVVNSIYGIAIFVKNDVQVINEGESLIHANPNYSGIGPTHSRILQYAKCRVNNQVFTVINVHGLWNGMGKTDTPERINQSIKIRQFMDSVNTPQILCGDFNLRPDTESIKILEQGMANHIDIFNIQSTRTSYYPGKEKFADYIFSSPEIIVKDFKVLPEEVSDHAPLLVEFIIR